MGQINFEALRTDFVPFDPWLLGPGVGDVEMPVAVSPTVKQTFAPEFSGRFKRRRGQKSNTQVKFRYVGDTLDQIEGYLDRADMAWYESDLSATPPCVDDCLTNAYNAVSTMTDLVLDFFKVIASEQKALALAKKLPAEVYQATRGWGNMDTRIEAMQKLRIVRTALAVQTVRKFGSNPLKHDHVETDPESAELALSVAETYCQTLKRILFAFPMRVLLRRPDADDWLEQMEVAWDPGGRISYRYTIHDGEALDVLRDLVPSTGDARSHYPQVERILLAVDADTALALASQATPELEGEVRFVDRVDYLHWLGVLFACAARPWRYET